MRLRLTKTTILFVSLFLLSYVFFMVRQLPANIAIQWLPQNVLQANNIRLQGIGGTIWNGQLTQARLNGFTLSNVAWQLHSMPLLWGDVAVAFKFRQADAFGNAEVTTDFGGVEAVLSSVQGSFPASQLMPLFYGFPIALDGQVSAEIQQAIISKGQQLSLRGEMLWREAALSAPQHILFGDLQVKMQPRDKGTVLTVQDQGGPLQLQGQIVVQGNGSYATTISVSARPTASKALAQSISILGNRDAQGNVQIQQQGKLPNW